MIQLSKRRTIKLAGIILLPVALLAILLPVRWHQQQMRKDDGLIEAVRSKRIVHVKTLLSWGANPDSPGSRKGMNALHYAAQAGQEKIVSLLLDKGANVNSQDSWGHTPLMLASWNGRLSTVRVLLNRGADPTLRKNQGRTTALSALRHNWGECVGENQHSDYCKIEKLLVRAEHESSRRVLQK